MKKEVKQGACKVTKACKKTAVKKSDVTTKKTVAAKTTKAVATKGDAVKASAVDKLAAVVKKKYGKELKACKDDFERSLLSEYKEVPAKEPKYIIEMSNKDFQLVSFYLELENREPITNIELKAKIKSNLRDPKGRFTKNDSIE